MGGERLGARSWGVPVVPTALHSQTLLSTHCSYIPPDHPTHCSVMQCPTCRPLLTCGVREVGDSSRPPPSDPPPSTGPPWGCTCEPCGRAGRTASRPQPGPWRDFCVCGVVCVCVWGGVLVVAVGYL
jgi:hypothetical protein